MVKRILVEKMEGFNVEATALLNDLRHTLGIDALEKVRIINCYDVEGLDVSDLEKVKATILSEPNVDKVYEDEINDFDRKLAFRVAFLPGQYDQRADSALQCIEIVTLKERPVMSASKIFSLEGNLDSDAMTQIKKYLINPVESHEVPLDPPETLEMRFHTPEAVGIIEGFIDFAQEELETFRTDMGFAMSAADLAFVRSYFKDEEKRNPTVTELKVIDTYWSDHCRHTTFMTEITDVEFEDGPFAESMKSAYEHYIHLRDFVYPLKDRSLSLMDLATINMKSLRKSGGLKDLDVSEEINACSIEIEVDVNDKVEPWLLMFKNETHNHPTEIEPFGGAATCLGGAIRDPLSGRSYVYQSMRVTGASDPTQPIHTTIEGKLPQKVITQKAAAGFSAYGNQIGLATGHVSEIYDDGFLAKRMEVGAVIGAAPKENVIRETPVPGDVIILVGGATGRDGVGGATGSSKAHDEDSLLECGAEVQKGNAPVERKIQRLFRDGNVTRLIKRCNDFGAGGVSVAIGELADSLEVNLDVVPRKYEGLDGTELAISESQERMAVVVAPEDADRFIEMCGIENLDATVVAKVTDSGRLIMKWKGQSVINLSRAFLDTNGVRGQMNIKVKTPDQTGFFDKTENREWLEVLSDLNVCSQKGLVERFDNTIGSGTILMPFGGVSESTPTQTMVAKIPVLGAETSTVSMMSYGYDPEIGKWSPFHGGFYAVVDSVAKLVATGADYKKIRLSLQEYFEKLGQSPEKWGKPFAALLGASLAQSSFGTAAIGGKDSMSGTFKDIHVPPTLISFAVATGKAEQIISPELKKMDSLIYAWQAKRDDNQLVDFDTLLRGYSFIKKGIDSGEILSAYAIGKGGIAVALTKMAFGNGIGVELEPLDKKILFEEAYGSIVFEVDSKHQNNYSNVEALLKVGKTTQNPVLSHKDIKIVISEAKAVWEQPLNQVFPTVFEEKGPAKRHTYNERNTHRPSIKTIKPKILIPIFPGTNCEYDTQIAFNKAGGDAETFVFRNRNTADINESIEMLVKMIRNAQILALPGGFSAGDEPEGSGKFIASVLRNPRVAEAVMELVGNRDGLMIGICNGFQALVKLGLLPYGEIKALDQDAPTLTFNKIGRHVARMGRVRVASVMSPWMADANVDEIYQTAFSHGEGRFYANAETIDLMAKNGQIATQYVDLSGNTTYDGAFNLNGSVDAIEGITSPDGRILGKMGHVERIGKNLYKNIYGEKDFKIIRAGVRYFE